MSLAKNELDKIHELRMSGKITQSEYEKSKKNINRYYSSPEMRALDQHVPAKPEAISRQSVLRRSRRKGLGLLIFIGLTSWFLASSKTAGGTKTRVADSFNMPMEALAVLLFVAGLIYMLPTFVAGLRRHPSYLGIAIVNLLLATTGVIWVACLVWAVTGRPDDS